MKKSLLALAALAACAASSGCVGTMSGVTLDNRVVCTAAGDKAFVVSEWGPVGVSAQIADQDRAVICGKK